MDPKERFVGVDVAMQLLRPGAKWEISNCMFTRWDDPRPCPSWQEVQETIDKIRAFEDSIKTIWLPEQKEMMERQQEAIEKALA